MTVIGWATKKTDEGFVGIVHEVGYQHYAVIFKLPAARTRAMAKSRAQQKAKWLKERRAWLAKNCDSYITALDA